MSVRLPAAAALLAAAAVPAQAAPGGELGTLTIGRYVCELPDPSGDSRGLAMPDSDFAIVSASSYAVGEAAGSYLRIGDEVTMTSGPRHGLRLLRETRGVLRLVGADGKPGRVRCVLVNRNNR